MIGLRQGVPTSKVLLRIVVYCIDSTLETFVDVLVFVHGPHLLDASTAHGIALKAFSILALFSLPLIFIAFFKGYPLYLFNRFFSVLAKFL